MSDIILGEKKADIIYIVEQTSACYFYRCFTPGSALAHLGYQIQVYSDPTKELMRSANLFVFQRPSREKTVEMIKEAQANGAKVIIEIDDDLWHIAVNNPAHKGWTPHRLELLENAIAAADMVTTTTESLADVVRHLNSNIALLPNCLIDDIWGDVHLIKQNLPKSRLTVGWAGSMTHWDDLRMIKPAIEMLAKKYSKVQFHFAGMPQLPFNKNSNIKNIPPVDIKQYPSLLATFDIGLAPVVDSQFNWAKSDLKFLENSALAIPTVASKVRTYSTCLHGIDSYQAENTSEWIKYISKLIDNPQLRKSMGKEARKFAESRFISQNINLWKDAYDLKELPNLTL